MNADEVVVTTAVENYIDMLLPDEERVERFGLTRHFDPKTSNPLCEAGIALHVTVRWGRYAYRILFDTGMTSRVLLHNFSALGENPHDLDHVVISHGHPDHYGGLLGLLEERDHDLPLSVGVGAFEPRYLRLASGQIAPYYNQKLSESAIDARGGGLVLHSEPLEIGPASFATGAIPREVPFEVPPTRIDTDNALIRLVDGVMVPDDVPDDQALVVNLGDDAILVFVGCSHAGIVNTLRRAMALSGRARIAGVFGGFHLGFPGTPREKIDGTLTALGEMDIELICPMHCTGLGPISRLRERFGERLVVYSTGTTVRFPDPRQ